jgi:hypothetical protein
MGPKGCREDGVRWILDCYNECFFLFEMLMSSFAATRFMLFFLSYKGHCQLCTNHPALIGDARRTKKTAE